MASQSPFEIVTTKKSSKVSSKKIIVGLSIIIFLVLGILTGVFLVRQQQDIREKAAVCNPSANQCPGKDGVLRSCNVTSYDESQCDSRFVGRIESCGAQTFCCNGTAWSTNMTACAVLTPTPTPTPTATAVTQSGLQSTPTVTPAKTSIALSTHTSTPTSTQSGTGGTNSTKTPSPTPATTKSPSPTPTSVSTQVAQATKPPVPETGTGLPTIFAMALGVLVIIGSFVLAF